MNYSIEEKAEALRKHTMEVTGIYKEKGYSIEVIDVGNEIEFGVLDERPPLGVDWYNTE